MIENNLRVIVHLFLPGYLSWLMFGPYLFLCAQKKEEILQKQAFVAELMALFVHYVLPGSPLQSSTSISSSSSSEQH